MSKYPFDEFKRIVQVEPSKSSHAPEGTGPVVHESPARLMANGVANDAKLVIGIPSFFREGDPDAAARNAGHVANHLLDLSEQMRANGALLDAPCLIVSDEEAEVATRAYLAFQSASFAPAAWKDLPADVRSMLVGHCKRSLAAGRMLDYPPPKPGEFVPPEPTESEREKQRICKARLLQVARLAVLQWRDIWPAPPAKL